MPLAGLATGVLVKSRKAGQSRSRGTRSTPGSLGATDVYTQASLLGLYDPDRSQSVTYLGAPRPWDEALNALRQALDRLRPARARDCAS